MNPPGGVSPPGQTALDLEMETPKVTGATMSGGGGGSVGVKELSALAAISLPKIADLMKGFSFPLSSTAAAAGTGILALIYSQDLGGASIYQIEGNEDLRIKRVEPERYGRFERRIGGEWYQTDVTAVPVLDGNQQVTGFEGLSEEDARKIRLPTTYPAIPPERMPPGGFQPYEGEDYSTMEHPAPEPGMTGGPTEFPADTGVPVAGVMTSNGTESENKAREQALKDVQDEIKAKDIDLMTGKDAADYLDYRANQMGVDSKNVHASTLGDTIIVRPEHANNPRVLREEVIHAEQNRSGKGSSDRIVQNEIEARELMIQNKDKWRSDRNAE